MKKIFGGLLLAAACMIQTVWAQEEMPYAKLLTMDKEALTAEKFKYDDYRNQYVLRKGNGWNDVANVLSAVNGATADIRPHPDDYMVVIQNGADGCAAWVDVLFYKDDTYHRLLTWAKDNGADLVETSSGKTVKHQFNYGGYSVELSLTTNGVQAVTQRTTMATAKTVDESYNTYHYVIYTPNPAASDYLTKMAAKQAKRDAKGKKKQSVDDLM